MLDNLIRRLAVVENALKQTTDLESLEKIDAFAKCAPMDGSYFPFSHLVRFLIGKAVELHTLRRSSTWKKVLETKELKGRVENIVTQVDEQTTILCVRDSFSSLTESKS
jgi:hypothetical protein